MLNLTADGTSNPVAVRLSQLAGDAGEQDAHGGMLTQVGITKLISDVADESVMNHMALRSTSRSSFIATTPRSETLYCACKRKLGHPWAQF